MVAGVKCPRCNSPRIWKYGFVPTIKGRKIRYKCTDCGHSFYKEAVRKKRKK